MEKDILFILDRFEGEYAVCQLSSGACRNLARVELPRGAKEGDVLRPLANGTYAVDAAETIRRRRAANELLKSLLYEDTP